MSLPRDLLEQARHLCRRDPRRPKQASLRRAVSTGYYAMFHLLIEQATTTVVSRPELRVKFARAFDHNDMKSASRAFSNGQPAHLTAGAPIPADLRSFADTFVQSQEARHEADYDTDRIFSRREAMNSVSAVDQAFSQWELVRKDPASRYYLSALLLWKKWSR